MSDLPGGTPHLGALVAQVSGHPGSKEREIFGGGEEQGLVLLTKEPLRALALARRTLLGAALAGPQ